MLEIPGPLLNGSDGTSSSYPGLHRSQPAAVSGSPARVNIHGWSRLSDVATRRHRPAARTNSPFSTVPPSTWMPGRPTSRHGPSGDPVVERAISKTSGWVGDEYLNANRSWWPVKTRAPSIIRSPGAGASDWASGYGADQVSRSVDVR